MKTKTSPHEYDRRTTATGEIRLAAAEGSKEGKIVEGYAIVYNSMSEDLGGFREIIAPGAVDAALEVSDIRALFNHDVNQILARYIPGRETNTLTLESDERGLKYSFEIPNNSAGRDLAESLRRGDITQSSFGFTVADGGEEVERSDELGVIRTVTKIGRMYDVSPVTYPAYHNSSATIRSITIEPNTIDGIHPAWEYVQKKTELNEKLVKK